MADIDNTKQEIVDFSFFTEKSVPLSSGPGEVTPKKTRSVSPKKKNVEKVDGEVVNTTSIDNYSDTMGALKSTVVELDMLATDLKSDLDAVRSSRTLKGRYQYSSMLGQNISQILATKVQAIKEINTTIKNALEYDYKLKKDRDAIMNGNDDQRLMDMYNAFISSPVSTNRAQLGPSPQQMMLPGESIQYSSPLGGPVTDDNKISPLQSYDPGFDNYMRNMTPEQSRMLMESNPDMKEVVTYNKATGEKHFEIMNTKTGEFVQGIAKHDDTFLEDCTINTRNKTARNVNLNESYPLVIIGENNMKNGF
jgi:hypothetical protein